MKSERVEKVTDPKTDTETRPKKDSCRGRDITYSLRETEIKIEKEAATKADRKRDTWTLNKHHQHARSTQTATQILTHSLPLVFTNPIRNISQLSFSLISRRLKPHLLALAVLNASCCRCVARTRSIVSGTFITARPSETFRIDAFWIPRWHIFYYAAVVHNKGYFSFFLLLLSSNLDCIHPPVHKEYFSTTKRLPDVKGMLHEREGAKKWKKRFCVLRASGIYFSTKGESEVSNGRLKKKEGIRRLERRQGRYGENKKEGAESERRD